MHDFDVERSARMEGDREFRIAGTVFTYRPAVAPEALIRWADMTETTPEKEAIEIIDDTVLAMLDPGQEQAWHEARDPGIANPVTAGDLLRLVQWLVSEQTGRPTTPLSDSSNGSASGTHGTNLTAVPASPEAAA